MASSPESPANAGCGCFLLLATLIVLTFVVTFTAMWTIGLFA